MGSVEVRKMGWCNVDKRLGRVYEASWSFIKVMLSLSLWSRSAKGMSL